MAKIENIMIEFTPFQQNIRDRFYKYARLIPPELAEIEEYIETRNNDSLVLSIKPKSENRSDLYVMVEDDGAVQIQFASHATFERFHPSIKGGGPEDAEYVERLIRAVICGRIEETAVLRNGEIIRSHIRIFSETGEWVEEQYWGYLTNSLRILFGNTEEKEIVYEPYLSPEDCESIK
ncbi:MAG: hypothetical protein ACYC27_11885 [Armatimonadota bacterium]